MINHNKNSNICTVPQNIINVITCKLPLSDKTTRKDIGKIIALLVVNFMGIHGYLQCNYVILGESISQGIIFAI